MTSQRIEYTGCAVTERFLAVTFTIGEPGAKRWHTVRVPITTLATMSGFLDVVHRQVEKDLRQHWELDEAMVLLPEGSDEFSTD